MVSRKTGRQTNRQVYIYWTDRRRNKVGKVVSRQTGRQTTDKVGKVVSRQTACRQTNRRKVELFAV